MAVCTALLFIYGENDPWPAAAFDLGAAEDSYLFTVPNGIDLGWAYNPGEKTDWTPDVSKYPAGLADHLSNELEKYL